MEDATSLEAPAEYHRWLAEHMRSRTGEALRRLEDGHGHAERLFAVRVWWPCVGSFAGLHPEFPVSGEDRDAFVDFAYISGRLRVAIEIDGYRPHHARLSRWGFTNQLRRQNELVASGWFVLRFPYDDVEQEAGRCQRTIRQFLGHMALVGDVAELPPREQILVRLVHSSQHPVTPDEAARAIGASTHTARTLLRRLVDDGWLVPVRGEKRFRAYGPGPRRLY